MAVDPAQVAAALQGRPQGGPPPGGGAPPQGGGQGGSLAQLAQVYAKCEQSGQCSPQDLAVLKQGLPNLIQMAQNIQKIIMAVSQGQGGQPPQGQQPNG